MHGGAPRVRHRKNADEEGSPITVNIEPLINKVADAAISAGVAYIISKA
jgi:hypothetical protein